MTKAELLDAVGVAELATALDKIEIRFQKELSGGGILKPILIKQAGGGKRIRPMISVLSAMACGHQVEDVIGRALAVEMIHQASLLHDKVIDAESKGEIADIILAGDYMIAAGLAAAPDYETVKILTECILEMARGQALQLSPTYRPIPNNKIYLETISLKTAGLFAAAARLGSRSNKKLEAFGLNFGTAFQLIDDIIDNEFTHSESVKAVPSAKNYMDKAIACLDRLPSSSSKAGLIKLASYYLKTSLPPAG